MARLQKTKKCAYGKLKHKVGRRVCKKRPGSTKRRKKPSSTSVFFRR